MILQMFTIYDIKAQAYHQPYFSPNQQTGQRAFRDAVNSPDSMLSKNPADFVLFECGEFDDSTGEVRQLTKLGHLGSATDYKE